MSDLVAALRKAKLIPQVALQQYMVLRSKAIDDFVCVFEGQDDYPYYDTVFRRVRDDFSYRPLIVNGKDQVLGLRDILLQRTAISDQRVAYFIDKDFDGHKGRVPSDNIYCTDGYSIENNLWSASGLSALLSSEFLCHKSGEEDRIPSIVSNFNDRLSEFETLMRETNRILYFARQTGVRLKGVENQITKYLTIDLYSVRDRGYDKLELLGWPDEVDPDVVPTVIPEFDQLNPLKDWRGKFTFGVYIELLHHLKEDRCSQAPNFFGKKCGIKFNPKGEVIRTLAILSPIPACLRSFVVNLDSVRAESLDALPV